MTFDIHREAEPHAGGSAFEPLTGAASRVKKSLRSRSGGLLTSTALVSVGFAFVAGSAAAQVPAGYAPAPAAVVSYVQLSNGSVLVQLANNQSLLVTSNNYFIDSAGVLYLSPSVGGNISGRERKVSLLCKETKRFPSLFKTLSTVTVTVTVSSCAFAEKAITNIPKASTNFFILILF